MTVGAIGAISSGESVYSVLSPYLNGVVRTADAAQLAHVDAASQTTSPAVAQSAIAANGDAAATATAAPPFANPAIADIALRIALGQSLVPLAGTTPDALLSTQTIDGQTTNSLDAVANLNTLASFNSTASVLTGDCGELIQANAATLFATTPAALQASAFAQAATPVIPAAAVVTAPPRISAVA